MSGNHRTSDGRFDEATLMQFVDGGLDGWLRDEVLDYLAERPEERARLDAYRQQNRRLQILAAGLQMSGSAQFCAPLQTALAERLAHGARWRLGWRMGAAAAAIAVVVATGALATGSLGELRKAPRSSASAEPTFYFPFDNRLVSLDSAAALQEERQAPFDWLSKHLSGFSISAPAVEQAGLKLVDGRTLENSRTPAIRLVYEDSLAQPLVLYVGVSSVEVRHTFQILGEGQVSLQWQRGPLVFALVAPTTTPGLSELVSLVNQGLLRTPAAEPAEAAPSGPVQPAAVPLPEAEPVMTEADPTITEQAKPEALPEAARTNEPESL